MIAPDDHRRTEFTARNHLVECSADPVTITEAQPADSARHSLEGNPFLRHIQPLMQLRVIRNQFFNLGIGTINVLRVSRKRSPAEGSDTSTEEWANVGGYEAGIIKGICDT